MRHVDHTKNIIELEHLSFAFADEEVLHDVSLNIHQGDYLGLIGPNGGGKTTLLKLTLGLLKPSAGTIRLFGQDRSAFRDWKKIGYVPQKVTNFDRSFPATVREVVGMGRYAQRGVFRVLTKEDYRLVETALDQVAMGRYGDRLIGDLSSGQQQRVFIARALASAPEVILLDEPTVGVDSKAQEEFYGLLHRLNSDLDLTLVLVSHDIDVVAQEATEIASLNRTLIYHGPPKELLAGNYLAKAYGKGLKFIWHGH